MVRFQLPSGHQLRLLEESDAEELYRLIDANRARLARWMAWAEPQTREQTLDFIRTTHRQLADDNAHVVETRNELDGIAQRPERDQRRLARRRNDLHVQREELPEEEMEEG